MNKKAIILILALLTVLPIKTHASSLNGIDNFTTIKETNGFYTISSNKSLHLVDAGRDITFITSKGKFSRNLLNPSQYLKSFINSLSDTTLNASKIISSQNFIKNKNIEDNIVDFSKTLLNIPYSWGGTSLNGFDCSGLTQYIYSYFKISLPRVAEDQAQVGELVKKEELKPGDLLFFSTDSTKPNYISHEGIYIGNNLFIHAATGSSNKVVISNLTDTYYKNMYRWARRIFK